MKEKTYLFRREDDGQVVEVDFATMMGQDAAGYITLPDGTPARRCLHLETERDGRPPRKESPYLEKPIVSDALGFCEEQLADFEEDRRANGFRGVEFVRDPLVPQFFQVKCKSRAEHDRYVKHRGMVNRSYNGGVQLSQEDLDRARILVERGLRGG